MFDASEIGVWGSSLRLKLGGFRLFRPCGLESELRGDSHVLSFLPSLLVCSTTASSRSDAKHLPCIDACTASSHSGPIPADISSSKRRIICAPTVSSHFSHVPTHRNKAAASELHRRICSTVIEFGDLIGKDVSRGEIQKCLRASSLHV